MIGAGNGQNKQDRANRSGRSRFGCWRALVFALVVFAFFMRGDFEASVILLDDLWDGESRQFVTGEYAAAIPARDMLAFCDSSSADGVAELQRIIERVQPTGDHLLTKTIYV